MADMGVCNEDEVEGGGLQGSEPRMADMLMDALAGLVGDGPLNQDEMGGCVYCGGPFKSHGGFYATANPRDHADDCEWLVGLRALQHAQSAPPSATGNEARPETTGPDTKSPDPRDAYIEELVAAMEAAYREGHMDGRCGSCASEEDRDWGASRTLRFLSRPLPNGGGEYGSGPALDDEGQRPASFTSEDGK